MAKATNSDKVATLGNLAIEEAQVLFRVEVIMTYVAGTIMAVISYANLLMFRA